MLKQTCGNVSCPAYFLHMEGKNRLVNGLFCFCSKHHIGGSPIRLLHENEITYCNKWRPKGLAVEVLYKGLSQADAVNGPAKGCQDSNECVVCASELAKWQGEVPPVL